MKRASGRHPLEIKGLAKSYGELQVIDGFTASISRGEKIALMGRNGAGKTTLLKALVRSATGCIEDTDRHFDVDEGIVAWGHEVAVVVSALSGYLAIGLLDRFTRRPRLNPFAFYCLGLGALLLGTGLLAGPGAGFP